MNPQKIRRVQTIISILLFITIFSLCWKTTEFSLFKIQLSYFGVNEKIGLWWNLILIVMGISLFVNAWYYIYYNNRLIKKNLFYTLFGLVSILLITTGIVTMHHKVHDYAAWFYFFLYPLFIYALAFVNKKTIHYKEWLGHIMFSTLMIALPLAFLHLFKGLAVSECLHSTTVLGWNLWLLFF